MSTRGVWLRRRQWGGAFTLIELLVVIGIIALLMSILVPTLAAARRRGHAVKCLANLRSLGQGIAIYLDENRDIFMPGRLPKIDDCNSYAVIHGRTKFRPTFLALLSTAVGVPPFDDPQPCRNTEDMFGEAGGRQNYSYDVYVCPGVPDWTDERNGCYGFNYQFLGNSRLFNGDDLTSYKNWPVALAKVRHPGRVVAAGDCMGTAASWAPFDRQDYDDDSRDADRYGNEGFNLDPPWVDEANGEMAEFDHSPQARSAADPRHANKANMLWVDGHASPNTLEMLGYTLEDDGVISFFGSNVQWSVDGRDHPWTPGYPDVE